MATTTGLDVLRGRGFDLLRGRSVGVVCNQAAVTDDYRHLLDLLTPLHREGAVRIAVVMGPQHGLFGHTQDNMIEWEGKSDPRTQLKVRSLYGENREPNDEMLEGVDTLLIDLFDVGSRYYTFIWTMALCLKACAARGIPVILLDRPNPIGGLQVEGPVQESGYESFVGLHPLPIRHGMTLGEIAKYLRDTSYPETELRVIEVEEWSRSDYLDDTDAPWAMPSPNMPTLDTAIVYPGACLLEGTNLSEGRGSTRPFEMVGAAWIDGWKLADALNNLLLPGVYYRPLQFQPTFHKFSGELCEGCFVHVTDRRAFEPVLSYVALLQEVRRLCGGRLAWNPPPYEYEAVKLPIDILAGNSWVRASIDNLHRLPDIRERFLAERAGFEPVRRAHLIYAMGV